MSTAQKLSVGGVLALIALGAYHLLFMSAQRGLWPTAALAIYGASPIPMVMAAVVFEKRSLAELFSMKHQSWAFMIGDTVFIPLAVIMAVIGWRHLDEAGRWYHAPLWFWSMLAVGALAGIGFHVMDRKGYGQAGAALAVDSPTKLVHDFVAVPVLFGGLLVIGMPLLVEAFRQGSSSLAWATALVLLAVIPWFVLQFYVDMQLRTLDPKKLHPQWSWAALTTIPYPKK